MVYQNKFVVAIKVNGQVLRESGDSVAIPFGSEYSVLIKNLNAVRAKFKLSIDGTDATSNSWIIVESNSSVEMERFILNGNWESGNRFKFIERTAQIEAHRGAKVEDGIVRVEYQTEIVRPVIPVPRYETYPVPYPRPPYYPYGSIRRVTAMAAPSRQARIAPTRRALDAGITVPGSVSNQRFVQGYYFETGNSDVIVLRLLGQIGGKAIAQPVTVKSVATCPTCGSRNKRAQFCAKCGTALELA